MKIRGDKRSQVKSYPLPKPHTVNFADTLDGKNIECVLLELGIRLHRVIYEHLMQFSYNSAGAMAVICDVQEYRRCTAEFKVTPLASTKLPSSISRLRKVEG